MERKILRLFVAVVLFLFVGIQPVLAQEEPIPEIPALDVPAPEIPGGVEGTGTYFEVTDSEYFNVTLESTEPLNVMLESAPQTVLIHLEAAEGAASAQITLGGFAPSTTYYKYEDDYHNGVTITTDANGNYTYTQDLISPHLVFIQTNPGTISIDASDGGDCILPIGTWDSDTMTCTLKQDVNEAIQIDSNMTLDGAGFTVTSPFPGYGTGIMLSSRTGVTIKNVTVQGFDYGIVLNYSSNNNLTGNTVSGNYTGIHLYYSNSNTLEGNTASNNNVNGIYLYRSDSNTLEGNHTSNNNETGILLHSSSSNLLEVNTASDNDSYGIYLYYSSRNILKWNTASNNNVNGIYLFYSSLNTLEGNTTSNNTSMGIYLGYSNSNTLTENTASLNNWLGIFLNYSSNNNLTGNTMSENTNNFRVDGNSYNDFYQTIDTTNTVEAKPIYYVVDSYGEVYDSSTNAGVFYAINCNYITIKDLTLSKNYYGVFLKDTHDSTIENVNASNNATGIFLYNSSNNILTENTASDNDSYGIYLYYSGSNALEGNTTSNSRRGIYLYWSSFNTLEGNTVSGNDLLGITLLSSSSNQIYNNNFIDNAWQAIDGGSGNFFNMVTPIGGNYWSEWTGPDADGDGFVDNPYRIYGGGQDDYPWVVQDGWKVKTPAEMIEKLQNKVINLNLHQGIENTLEAKLQAVQQALADLNENNDVAAINTLGAFRNAVGAQRGKKIPEINADELIAAAQAIIVELESQ